MKALEMMMARDLKRHKHYQMCVRCGHMNNGKDEIYKRICQCATPILRPEELAGNKPMNEIRELEQFRHHFKGDSEVAWGGKAPTPDDIFTEL